MIWFCCRYISAVKLSIIDIVDICNERKVTQRPPCETLLSASLNITCRSLSGFCFAQYSMFYAVLYFSLLIIISWLKGRVIFLKIFQFPCQISQWYTCQERENLWKIDQPLDCSFCFQPESLLYGLVGCKHRLTRDVLHGDTAQLLIFLRKRFVLNVIQTVFISPSWLSLSLHSYVCILYPCFW